MKWFNGVDDSDDDSASEDGNDLPEGGNPNEGCRSEPSPVMLAGGIPRVQRVEIEGEHWWIHTTRTKKIQSRKNA